MFRILSGTLLSLTLAGCGCDGIEYGSGLVTFELQPPIERAGAYEVRFSTEAGTGRCTFALPPPEGENQVRPDCVLDDALWESMVVVSTALRSVVVSGQAERVELTITRDGAPYVSTSVEPDWGTEYPQGRFCQTYEGTDDVIVPTEG